MVQWNNIHPLWLLAMCIGGVVGLSIALNSIDPIRFSLPIISESTQRLTVEIIGILSGIALVIFFVVCYRLSKKKTASVTNEESQKVKHQ